MNKRYFDSLLTTAGMEIWQSGLFYYRQIGLYTYYFVEFINGKWVFWKENVSSRDYGGGGNVKVHAISRDIIFISKKAKRYIGFIERKRGEGIVQTKNKRVFTRR